MLHGYFQFLEKKQLYGICIVYKNAEEGNMSSMSNKELIYGMANF